jgi:hypothetical protein
MSDTPCTHKVVTDHQSPVKSAEGRAIWICTGCGVKDVWGEDWAALRIPECPTCGRVIVEKVYCGRCVKRHRVHFKE